MGASVYLDEKTGLQKVTLRAPSVRPIMPASQSHLQNLDNAVLNRCRYRYAATFMSYKIGVQSLRRFRFGMSSGGYQCNMTYIITLQGSTAEVYCHGAHVTSWKTSSGEASASTMQYNIQVDARCTMRFTLMPTV